MTVEESYKLWSENPYFDYATRKELLDLAGNETEIRDRFYRELEFGTAGIRGLIGPGTNRINVYVVRRVSLGIAEMVKARGEAAMKRGIVIGYDSRNFSRAFAEEAAAVYAANGIRTYLHCDLTPVPVLSYSVRTLGCEAGVMVTASHNPKEYNGYKVYGADGAQMNPEDSAFVTSIVEKITDYSSMPVYDYAALKAEGKIEDVPEYIRTTYFEEIKKLTVSPDKVKENASKLKLIYTPLHGAGAKWVPDVLGQLGYTNLHVVPEQMIPDGNFSTLRVPNPENRDVYDYAVKLAEQYGAKLVLATDPDSDRTGAFIKDRNGEYVMLTGNQIGAVILNYILSTMKAENKIPENGFVVTTIVSSRLAKYICEDYGIDFVSVLTGFKFIGEQIVLREEKGDQKFLFGFEESYGYLAGTYARDKDAVASCMLLAEAAAFYNAKGMTLLDALEEIYKKYGYFADSQFSFEFKGESGANKMKNLMESLRARKTDVIDENIGEFTDVLEGIVFDKNGEQKSKLTLPSSNVLLYTLDDGWFAVRPSGTEPKVKFYFGIRSEKSMADAVERMEIVKAKVKKVISE